MRGTRWLAFAMVLALPLTPATAAPARADLTQLSLEQLLQTEVTVTSVSRHPEPLTESPAAVTVLTSEDIRRSGATSIPDALRMVPGLIVAQIDSNRWAISVRGFNAEFANKLLVLIDGRIVYDPLFAGVYWNAQDVMLEDVDRIEVIRGPGATLWGSNAVNGVINIVTLAAGKTQGGLLSVTTGKYEKDTGAFRYGAHSGDADVRVSGKTLEREAFTAPDGAASIDAWRLSHGSLRADWKGPHASRDAYTLQADAYDGNAGQSRQEEIPIPFTRVPRNDQEIFSGNDVLGRWTHTSSPTRSTSVLAYLDHTDRMDSQLSERRDTFDLELLQNLAVGSTQNLVLGASYRTSTDHLQNLGGRFVFAPPDSTLNLYSFFAQDEIELHPKRFRLTLGTKLEHNDFTGWEMQPTVRALYRLDAREVLWSAVSRAVRIPTRVEEDVSQLEFPRRGDDVIGVLVTGSHALKSEIETSYELGYRVQASSRLSLDLATFYADYRDLQDFDPGAAFTAVGPQGPVPAETLVRTNSDHGNTFGGELAATWRATKSWKLVGDYTLLQARAAAATGENPPHQFHLRSLADLSRAWQLDLSLYSVDAVTVPDYTRVDARIGWRPKPGVDLSLVAQNLFSGHHVEFNDPGTTVIVPATFLRLVCSF